MKRKLDLRAQDVLLGVDDPVFQVPKRRQPGEWTRQNEVNRLVQYECFGVRLKWFSDLLPVLGDALVQHLHSLSRSFEAGALRQIIAHELRHQIRNVQITPN